MTFNNTTIANELYPVANGTVSSSPFVVVFQPRAPTTSDIQYPIQKIWLNTGQNDFWFLKNFNASAGITTANWIPLSSFASVETLTGNTGGAVPPDGANTIFVVGDGVTITTSGNPATNTLTISSLSGALNYTDVVGPITYVVLPTDYYLSCNTTGGDITLNFPDVPTFKQTWIVKDRTGNASVNNISITTPGGAVTFDGLTIYTIAGNYGSVNLLANSTPTYEVW